MTGWVGWIWFAGMVMIMDGLFNVINGLYAIFSDNLYVQTRRGWLAFDLAPWGWVHLIIGVLLVIVGIAVSLGLEWARVVAIILVIINAVTQMAWIAVNPWWSMIVIAVDVVVLYALIVHGREAASLRP
ncbi:hypothetical protein [Streptosporangium sp. NPDC051022]|uniref:DUF7144 family membrane protein n=1 Tax=Streptosporangium sp. NPDC051022 TaxID=3155752 RepID=UPI0034329950